MCSPRNQCALPHPALSGHPVFGPTVAVWGRYVMGPRATQLQVMMMDCIVRRMTVVMGVLTILTTILTMTMCLPPDEARGFH